MKRKQSTEGIAVPEFVLCPDSDEETYISITTIESGSARAKAMVEREVLSEGTTAPLGEQLDRIRRIAAYLKVDLRSCRFLKKGA